MIMTKGIPFKRLTDFLTTDQLPSFVIERLTDDLVINLKSGFNPVSNRTNIKIGSNFNELIIRSAYDFLLTKYQDVPYFEKNSFIANSTSGGKIDQLSFYKSINTINNLSDWLLYTKPTGFQNNLATLINDIIFNIDKYIVTKGIMKSINIDNLRLPILQQEAIKIWFKNKELSSKFKEKKEKEILVEIKDNVPKFITSFISAFWNVGLKLEKDKFLIGTNFYTHANAPKLIIKPIDALGSYDESDHVINLNPTTLKKDLVEKINQLDKFNFDNFQSQFLSYQKDPDYQSLLGIRFPSSILLHELSHAWRNEKHLYGVHQDIDLTINGLKKNYSFDEGANEVARIIMLDKFLEDLWYYFTH